MTLYHLFKIVNKIKVKKIFNLIKANKTKSSIPSVGSGPSQIKQKIFYKRSTNSAGFFVQQ